ncbi:MAG: L-histidine N(alpha)-methyltransferase [bacterium]|nr:L-histidine N(alpha)-methyltransferase [bacterium]
MRTEPTAKESTDVAAFAASVLESLESHPKRLESKYLYDDRGDELFRKITELPEYYLTACELEILYARSHLILKDYEAGAPLDVVELGAGDGTKAVYLLEEALHRELDLKYIPMDISSAALDRLSLQMALRLPQVEVVPLCGDYLTSLHELHQRSSRPELLLFLGSNIGNYSDDDAVGLLRQLAYAMVHDDRILVGFDLRKNPNLIHQAYNDEAGITREFNLNLLRRINRELGADFDLDRFDHYEHYDPVAGEALSFLVSLSRQTVTIEALEKSFRFGRHELVHTERSRKYSPAEIETLARQSGLEIVRNLYDTREYFTDVLMAKRPHS